MASTTQTTYYELPVYSGSDIASWTDTNTPFQSIDTAIYTAAQTASSAASDVSTLSSTVSGHTTSISNINTDISALQLADTNMDTRVGNIETTVGGHTTSIANNTSNISANANAISDIEEDITDVEATNTATKAYSVGDTLIYDHELYKVTTAIEIGDTLTVGTNISKTTLQSIDNEHATMYTPQLITTLVPASGITIVRNDSYKIGKLVIFNVSITMSGTITGGTPIITGLPHGPVTYPVGTAVTAVSTNRASLNTAMEGIALVQGSNDIRVQFASDFSIDGCTFSAVYVSE